MVSKKQAKKQEKKDFAKKPATKAAVKRVPVKRKAPAKKVRPVAKDRAVLSKRARALTSPKGTKFKDIEIKIHYVKGVANMRRAYVDWEAAIAALRLNPRVYASNTLIYYEHNDIIQAYPLSEARISSKRAELEENFEKIKDNYLIGMIGDLKLLYLVIHVIFKSEYVKRKK